MSHRYQGFYRSTSASTWFVCVVSLSFSFLKIMFKMIYDEW